MYKAFQGPNGWYVSFERDDGFHGQPPSWRSQMSERAARREARERNSERQTAGDQEVEG